MSVIDLDMIRKTIKFNEDPIITNRLNKKNLHKWNISKRTGFYIILNIITNILKERKNNNIKLDELSLLINKRYKETHNFIIKKNRKPKSLYNFLKLEFNGLNHIIDYYLYNIYFVKKGHLYLKDGFDNNIGNKENIDNYLMSWHYITDEEISNI